MEIETIIWRLRRRIFETDNPLYALLLTNAMQSTEYKKLRERQGMTLWSPWGWI